jgi:Serine/threonine protein kinase
MIIKGQKIDGRYQIIRTIGEGGMANVYLAYDTILDREVAVKVLRGDLANDEKFVKRFQREAKAASSLNHPNIVEMYDVGEDNGNYFLVMEYVDGRTLKNLIKKRGALSLTEVIDIMLQLTSAIACAHDSYIIHRDLKPQNVMILEDGRAKIMDFGIAIALNSTELTQTNSVMGSVHYLPPEQANGSGTTIKSDIYSLGILMYELLTGKLPFKGENAVEIAIKQMKEKLPGICSQNELIPQSIENIVLRACAKNPKNRYDSVAEMHEDLKTGLSAEKKEDKRVVYKYQENDLDETKALPNLSKMTETREERNEDVEEEVKTGKKKGKKLKVAAIIAIILTIIVAISVLIGALSILKDSQNTTISLPSIAGKSKEVVDDKLTSLGLIIIYEEEPSDDIDVGYVIDYEGKKTNSKVKKGSTVTVIVSSGLGGVLIEDYTGRNINVVQLELEAQGIKVVATGKKMSSTEEENEDIVEGMVLSQSKGLGTRLKEGGVIEITYATLITTYPDFTDGTYNADSIQSFCDDNVITCDITYQETNSYSAGTIISQSRSKGVEVKAGVTLRIVIAKAVTIPVIPDPDEG